MSFEETKQLLAKHLQETSRARSCCSGAHSSVTSTTGGVAVGGPVTGNGNGNLQVNSSTVATGNYHHPGHEEPANFDGIDLGVDDQTPVPLGDILDKLQEESDSLSQAPGKKLLKVINTVNILYNFCTKKSCYTPFLPAF